MGDLLAAARRLVTPSRSEEERLKVLTSKVLGRTRLAAERHPEVTGVVLGGSLAKGTWLPGGADIDVFVKIAPETEVRRFETVGLEVGREVVRGYPHGKKYAQHPYTEATMDGTKVNVVPCYDVKPGEWKSAADRSPYHVQFVLEKFDRAKRLEVRLLKRFLTASGVYGAEIELEGFSGYAAEVLVHGHGSFGGVVRFFARVKPAAAGESFLVIKDPVDEKRNLARAISMESFAKVVLASRGYLQRPSLEFFTGRKRVVRRPLLKRVIALRFDHEELSEDTLWGELKRTAKHLVRHAEAQGFHFIRAAAASDNKSRSALLLLAENEVLPDLEERVGPHVSFEAETAAFIEKNRSKSKLVWAGEDGRLRTLQRRKHTRLVDLLEGVVEGEITKLGASREVATAISKTGRVMRGERLAREAAREEWMDRGLKELVSDTLGTDRR